MIPKALKTIEWDKLPFEIIAVRSKYSTMLISVSVYLDGVLLLENNGGIKLFGSGKSTFEYENEEYEIKLIVGMFRSAYAIPYRLYIDDYLVDESSIGVDDSMYLMNWRGLPLSIVAQRNPDKIPINISVHLGGKLLLESGGSYKFSTITKRKFKYRGEYHKIKLITGFSWLTTFPFTIYIDHKKIAKSTVKIGYSGLAYYELFWMSMVPVVFLFWIISFF